jgi:hypothetical protein
MPPVVTREALLKLATDALPDQLAKLAARGVARSNRVYAFFNGAIPPGIGVATAQMESTGLSRIEARRTVEGLIAQAETRAECFALGSMLPPEDLMNLLHSSTRDPAIHQALDRLTAALAKAVPPDHIRMVLVNGSDAMPYLLELQGDTVVTHRTLPI